MKISDQHQISTEHRRFLLCECCFWFYQLAITVLSLWVLSNISTSFDINQSLINSQNYLHAKETVSFWQKGYIIDIRKVSTSNCPQGYNPLITYSWNGTVAGCYCSSAVSSHSFELVLKGQCSGALIGYGCRTIPASTKLPLNTWKGKKLLCIKRAAALSFYSSTNSSIVSSVCASDQPFKVYTLPGVSCPITTFSNSTLSSSTTLQLDSSGSILSYVSQQGYPIADFKLTQYAFCSQWSQNNISPSKSEGSYVLGNSVSFSPCTANDSRVVEVDEMTEEDFFSNNSRVSAVISALPSYPAPSISYIYKLGYVPYPTWTYACRASSTLNLLAATETLLMTKMINALQILLSVCAPCLILLALILRIFFIGRHARELKEKMFYNAVIYTEQEISLRIPTFAIQKSMKKETIIYILEILIVGAVLATMLWVEETATNQSQWIKQASKCTDMYVMGLLRINEAVVDAIAFQLLKGIIAMWIIFILSLVYWILRVKYGDLSFKEQIQEVSVEEIPEKQSMEESSHIINNKEDLQIMNIENDNFMDGGETKINFYVDQKERKIIKKTKKKKYQKIKKNLFKYEREQNI